MASGGAHLLAQRRSVPRVLDGETLDVVQRRKLELTQRARDFATEELGLPDNKSYRSYVELDRRYVTWNVVATPALSVEPLRWCFPVAGCVSYRGYFKEARARGFANKLAAGGHDVVVQGVDAYSTLGRFADPVLSTFLRRSDTDLAALLFHELAHQQLYVKGDTTFNESFATVVEHEGVRRWLEAEGRGHELERVRRDRELEREFVDLLLDFRRRLEEVYGSALGVEAKRQAKADLFSRLKQAYARAKVSWGDDRYDGWFDRPLNNAHLAGIADYHALVAPLWILLEQSRGDLAVFYRRAAELGGLEPLERQRRLKRLVAGHDEVDEEKDAPPADVRPAVQEGGVGSAGNHLGHTL